MGHGHVLNLNRWRYKKDGTVLNNTSCAFGDGHLGQFCNRTRVCGIDNCKEVHHRLLHKTRNVTPSGHVRGVGVEKKEEPQPAHKQDDSASEDSRRNEGESKDRTGQASDTYTAVSL